ncbi:hypothetical protein N9N03_02075 [Chlamydiia bacterium]|nr:hypothetical protein [Chlamydiia bacterium]
MTVDIEPTLFIHWLTSFAMTVVIWFVQLVHYPIFIWGNKTTFNQFMREHQYRITIIVAPLMLVELWSAHVFIHQHITFIEFVILTLNAVIWLSTILLQVPYHNVLSTGYNKEIITKLVHTNWIRTIAWTVKTGLVSILIFQQHFNT